MNEISLPVLSSSIIEGTDREGSSVTGHSVFSDVTYSLENYNGLFITERIDSLNFRHRVSEAGYFSSWHVAGDPTLIIIRTGTLRITLRNGDYRDFSAGNMFIAQDCLQVGEAFDNDVHGHTAEIVGKNSLSAVHIKLALGYSQF